MIVLPYSLFSLPSLSFPSPSPLLPLSFPSSFSLSYPPPPPFPLQSLSYSFTVAKAVSTINAVVDGGDPEPLMEALTAPSAGIRSVTAECAESYQEKLSQAKQEKVEAGRWGEVRREGGWE